MIEQLYIIIIYYVRFQWTYAYVNQAKTINTSYYKPIKYLNFNIFDFGLSNLIDRTSSSGHVSMGFEYYDIGGAFCCSPLQVIRKI